MKLYLIRHGEIVKKYLNRYVGSTDVGLSHTGKRQAKKLAKFFKNVPIDMLYTSSLNRATQTALPLTTLLGIRPREDKRLAEIDFGPWEGKSSLQIQKMIPKNVACSTVTSGGEHYSHFVKRVNTFFQELQETHKNKTVVVVTHKGVIREAYKYFLNDNSIVVDQIYGCVNYLTISDKITVVYTNKTL